MAAISTSPQTWLITGCSSGFGELFVRQLRSLGDNVIATGRNAETKLAHLKDTGAAILDLDVAAPEAEIQSKMDEAWAIYPGGIDVVVNNAGYVLSAAFEELTQADLETCFRTNFHGPLNITRALLPKLRIDLYEQFNAGVRAYEEGIVGNEPGDPSKAVKLMIELAKGNGVAVGKTVPLRVPIGTDGWTKIRAKCEETIKVCDEWEDVAKSTGWA